MPTFCEREFRDIDLLDNRLSSLSRHSGALNDLIATLLMTNTAFQNRARQRVENYDKDVEPINIFMSEMESTK